MFNFRVFKYILLIIPFLSISIFNNLGSFKEIFQIIATTYMTLSFVGRKMKVSFDKIDFALIIMCFYQLFISLLKGTLSFGIFFSVFSFSIALMYSKKEICLGFGKDYIKALYSTYVFLLIVNFPSVISSLSLSEYNKVFWVGGKNVLALLFIPAIFYIFVYSLEKNSRLTKFNFFMILLSVLTIILGGSSTGFIVAIVSIGFILFGAKLNIDKKVYYIIYIILLLLMLNSAYLERIDFVKDFIINTLNKDFTFSGRAEIWTVAKYQISNNLLGYGRGNCVINRYFHSLSECHNATLELLLVGGIPLLFVFVYLINSCLSVKKNSSNYFVVNLGYCFIFLFALIGLTESVQFNLDFWRMLIIISQLNFIFKGGEKNG